MAKKPRPIRIEGDVAYVPLTQDYEAIIDAADVPLIDGVCWCACPRRREDGSIFTVYASAWITGRPTRLHRVLLAVGRGEIVDHVNCDGLDNRRANLRVATVSQNAANMRLSVNNTSGFKGVFWHGPARKWTAKLYVNNVRSTLGVFDDKTEAARAYDRAMVDAFGEFALTNEALGLLPATVGGAV